jgi:aerobic-type carbon monoxide dehydrogenase small subunit (CoxS/CutS family)
VDATGHRVAFACDGRDVDVECAPGESLLSVLRERLGLESVKDGCAPQGQCGCCTVLVDGEARVACVTPVERVANRSVTTTAGLDAALRTRLAEAFVATGGSQCGFCTPGIMVRAAALLAKGRTGRVDVDRALAAHLCRCTGWQSVYEAIDLAAAAGVTDEAEPDAPARSLDAASLRAALEGGVAQRVGTAVPVGDVGFADDNAPRDALVAVPLPPGVDPEAVGAREVAGQWWVVGESLADARVRAEKVQGRRTTVDERPPLAFAARPSGAAADAVRLATGWVEPAYLEPDASWCAPGGMPASPLANGGAFGGKAASLAPLAARELADAYGRIVRVVYSREDTVRLGPKRPPIAAYAWREGDVVQVRGIVANGAWEQDPRPRTPYSVDVDAHWEARALAGPPTGAVRALGMAEHAVLVDAAIDESLGVSGEERTAMLRNDRYASVALDSCVTGLHDACAGARVHLDPRSGVVTRVEVRVAAGDPLDEVVLRSYSIGAAHMALGWVCTEGLAVDPDTGEVLDLTIRSFGVVRPARTPPIDVTVVDDPGPPLPEASDSVFAAVAAATWNAIARAEGTRPETWPARDTRAARALRR